MNDLPFQRATARLSIGTTDQRPNFHVDAQYNPKEIQIDRSVPWTPHSMSNAASPSDDDAPGDIHLEFTGAKGRSMTVEMLFDGYEEGRSIAAQVDSLEAMATVPDPSSSDQTLRRPALCVVSWGNRGVPSFRCVIEQLSTKYTMFASDGTPLRAVCTVKLLEATKLSLQGNSSSEGRAKNRVAMVRSR